MYCMVRLDKQYFLVRGSDVIFFDYPTLLVVLVVIQSSINSQAVKGLCFVCDVGHRPTYLELHIVFFWVFRFLLLIIQIG
jgi:hypothetical protein